MAPRPLILCLLLLGTLGTITIQDQDQGQRDRQLNSKYPDQNNDFESPNFDRQQNLQDDNNNYDDNTKNNNDDNTGQQQQQQQRQQQVWRERAKCQNFRNLRARLNCLAQISQSEQDDQGSQDSQQQQQDGPNRSSRSSSSQSSQQQNDNDASFSSSSSLSSSLQQLFSQSDDRNEQRNSQGNEQRSGRRDQDDDRNEENDENDENDEGRTSDDNHNNDDDDNGNDENVRRRDCNDEKNTNDDNENRSERKNSNGVHVPVYCHLPAHTGPCKASIMRYAYDPINHECKSFTYGGCQSNGNNFKTKETCERTCKIEVCDRPKHSGKCLAYIPRYYYDINEQNCKQFIYGGCGSNGNNFVTKNDCSHLCNGVVPDNSDPDYPVDPDQPDDPTNDPDVPDDPTNDPDDPDDVPSDDNDTPRYRPVPAFCHLPAHTGPCRAAISRYFYDYKIFECRQFTYGGCNSNGNNFYDKESCERTCKREVCDQPKYPGPCYGYFPRYYYDNGICRRFIYGGCQSNGNNFEDRYTCESVCAALRSGSADQSDNARNSQQSQNEELEIQNNDQDSNANEGDQDQDGNQQNIESQEQQYQRPNAILKNAPECDLPPKTGPCRAYISRWYYDRSTKKCKTFIYGGCQPNTNNFKTKDDCEEACADPLIRSSRKKRSSGSKRSNQQYKYSLQRPQNNKYQQNDQARYNKQGDNNDNNNDNDNNNQGSNQSQNRQQNNDYDNDNNDNNNRNNNRFGNNPQQRNNNQENDYDNDNNNNVLNRYKQEENDNDNDSSRNDENNDNENEDQRNDRRGQNADADDDDDDNSNSNNNNKNNHNNQRNNNEQNENDRNVYSPGNENNDENDEDQRNDRRQNNANNNDNNNDNQDENNRSQRYQQNSGGDFIDNDDDGNNDNNARNSENQRNNQEQNENDDDDVITSTDENNNDNDENQRNDRGQQNNSGGNDDDKENNDDDKDDNDDDNNNNNIARRYRYNKNENDNNGNNNANNGEQRNYRTQNNAERDYNDDNDEDEDDKKNRPKIYRNNPNESGNDYDNDKDNNDNDEDQLNNLKQDRKDNYDDATTDNNKNDDADDDDKSRKDDDDEDNNDDNNNDDTNDVDPDDYKDSNNQRNDEDYDEDADNTKAGNDPRQKYNNKNRYSEEDYSNNVKFGGGQYDSQEDSLQRNRDDDSRCATTCQRAHEKFNMKKNKVYKYHYEADIDASIRDRETSNGNRKHPISGHKISAEVEIRVIDDCELELRITSASVKGKQSFQSVSNTEEDETENREIAEDMKRHPLRFSFDDGKIDHVCGQREENPIVIDIKKGILSIVQNTMSTLSKDQEKVYEGDLSGVCPTIYQTRKSDEQRKTVKKTKDLSKCMTKAYDEESLGYAPTISENVQKSVALVKGKKECVQKFTRDKLLKSSECKEEFVFQGPGHSANKQNSQSAQTISVETRQRLTYKGSRSQSQQNRFQQHHRQDNYVRSRLYSDANQQRLQDAKDGNPRDVLDHLEKLSDEIDDGVTVDAPELFLQLVARVKTLSKEAIIEVYENLKGSNQQSADAQDKKAQSYKFLIDAIPMAATLESVQAMVEIIKSRDLSPAHTKYWVLSWTFITNPEVEMVEAIEPLVHHFKTNPDIAMAVTSLIHNLAKVRPNYQDLDEIPAARKIQNVIVRILRSSCDRASSDLEQNKQVLLALKALGNMGHSPHLISEVRRCVQKNNVPREIKSAAVESYRRMPCEAHRELMNLFQSDNDVEVRIKAFFLLHKCPNPQSMSEIKQTLQNEANKDVLTMAYTFYQNLAESSDPDKETVQFLANEAGIVDAIRDQATRYITQVANQGNNNEDGNNNQGSNRYNYQGKGRQSPSVSRHFESSLYSETLDTGIVSEGHILYDRALPRSASYNLTLDLFGLNFNIFELALQLEMTDYLSDASYSPQNLQQLQQQSSLINLLQQSASSSSSSQNNQQSNDRKRSYSQRDEQEQQQQQERQQERYEQQQERKEQQQQQGEQDQHEQNGHLFNAFDNYANGGDYSDVSSLASGLVQFVSDPRFEKLRAISSIKIQGNEIAFFDIFGKDVKETLANPFALVGKLARLARPQKQSITESTLLFDSTTLIQTGVGIPLNVTIRSALVTNVEMKGKMDFSKMLTSSHAISVTGRIKPSAAVKTHISLSLSGVSKSGVGISSIIHTNTEISGELHLGLESGMKAKLILPEDKQEILSTWNEFFLISHDGEKKLDKQGVKSYKCSGEKVHKILGIKACVESVHPSVKASNRKVPTGVLATKITIEKSDSSIKYHDIQVKISKKAQSSYDVKASVDTPGSSINRHLVVHGDLNSDQNTLRADLQGPNLHWEIDGKVDDDSKEKTSARVTVKTGNNRVHKVIASYKETYNHKEGKKSKYLTYDYIDPNHKNTYAKLNMSYTASPKIQDIQQQTQQTSNAGVNEKHVLSYWGQVHIPDTITAHMDGIASNNKKSSDIKFNSEYTLANKEKHRINLKKYIFYERKKLAHTFKYVSTLESTQFPNMNHDVSLYSDLKTNDNRGTLRRGMSSGHVNAHVYFNERSWMNASLSLNNRTNHDSEVTIQFQTDESGGRKVVGTGTLKADLSASDNNNEDKADVARLHLDVKYDARRRPDRRVKIYWGLDKVSSVEFHSDGQIDIYPRSDFESTGARKGGSTDSLYVRYVLAINKTTSLKALIDYDLGVGKQYYNLRVTNPYVGDRSRNVSVLLEQKSSEKNQDAKRDKDLNRISASLYLAEHVTQARVDVDVMGDNEDYKLTLRHKTWSRPNDKGISTRLTASSPLWLAKNVDMLMNVTVRDNKVDGKLKLTHNNHKLVANADGSFSHKSVNVQVKVESSFEQIKSLTLDVQGDKIDKKWNQKYEIVWRAQDNREHHLSMDISVQLHPHIRTQIRVHSSTMKNMFVDITVTFEPNLHLLLSVNYNGNKVYIKTVFPRKGLRFNQQKSLESQELDVKLPVSIETNVKLIVNEYTLKLGFAFTNLPDGLSVNWNVLITPMMSKPIEIVFKSKNDDKLNVTLKIQLTDRTLLATLQHEKKKDVESKEYYVNTIEIHPDLESEPQDVIRIESMANALPASDRNLISDKWVHKRYNITTSIKDTHLDTPWIIQTFLDFNDDNALVKIESRFFYTQDKSFGVEMQLVDRSRIHLTNVTWLFRISKTDTKLDWAVKGHYATSQNGWRDLQIASSYLMSDGQVRSIKIKYNNDPQAGVQVTSIDVKNTDVTVQIFINNKKPNLMAIIQIGDPNSNKGSTSVINLNTETQTFNIKYREKIYLRASVDTDTKMSAEIYSLEPNDKSQRHQIDDMSDKQAPPSSQNLPALTAAVFLNDSHHVHLNIKWDPKNMRKLEDILTESQGEMEHMITAGVKHLIDDIKSKLKLDDNDNGLNGIYQNLRDQLKQYAYSVYNEDYQSRDDESQGQSKHNYRQSSQVRQKHYRKYNHNSRDKGPGNDLTHFISDVASDIIMIKRNLKRVILSSKTLRYKAEHVLDALKNKMQALCKKIKHLAQVPEKLHYKLKQINLLSSSSSSSNSNSLSQNLLNLLSSSNSRSQSSSSSSNSWSRNLASQSLALIGLKRDDDNENNRNQQRNYGHNLNYVHQLKSDVRQILNYLKYAIPNSQLALLSWPNVIVSDEDKTDLHVEVILPFPWTSFKYPPDINEASGLRELLNVVREIKSNLGFGDSSSFYAEFYRSDNDVNLKNVAALVNGSHVLTWDKIVYPIGPFACQYTLAKDTSTHKSWSISASHGNNGDLVVKIDHEGQHIQLGPGQKVLLDNSQIRLPSKSRNFEILRTPESIIVQTNDRDLYVKYHIDSNSVMVAVSKEYDNDVAGLLGTNDNDQDNEFTNPGGEVILHIQDLESANAAKSGKGAGLKQFLSSWLSNSDQQCQENIEIEQNAQETIGQSDTNNMAKMYQNIANTFVQKHGRSVRKCNGKYTQETLKNIFANLPAHNPRQAVCSLRWALSQECILKGYNLATPKACGVCKMPTANNGFNHHLNQRQTVTVTNDQYRDDPRPIHIIYVLEENTKLKNIEYEIVVLIETTHLQLSRDHPSVPRLYSVAGYGNKKFDQTVRIYTNAEGDSTFSIHSLAQTIRSLELTETTQPRAVTAIYDVLQMKLFKPTAHKIMHLIAISKTDIHYPSPNTLKLLLQHNGVTLHALIPCTLNTGVKQILGVDKKAAYTVHDVNGNPVLGDRELRKQANCHDPIFDVAQWNEYGSVFDINIVRRHEIVPKKAVLNIQPRLLSQGIKKTSQRCQCTMNVDNLATVMCSDNKPNMERRDHDSNLQRNYRSNSYANFRSENNGEQKNVASLVNGSHILTWDKHVYPLGPFTCKYILAKDKNRGTWSVSASHNGDSSLIVSIIHKGEQIQLGPGQKVFLHNSPVALPVKRGNLEILRDPEDIIVTTRNNDFYIKYHIESNSLLVAVSNEYANDIAGIFGTNDNDQNNEFTSPSGEVLLHIQDLQSQSGSKSGSGASLQQFLSSWMIDKQCHESIDVNQDARETLGQSNSNNKMYRDIAHSFIQSEGSSIRNCHPMYTRRTLHNIFDNVPAQNSQQALCSLASTIAQECNLKGIKISAPTPCGVCQRSVYSQVPNQNLGPNQITVELPQYIHIIYIFEESRKLTEIEDEIATSIRTTNLEIRRTHPGLIIQYSVVGYGNKDFGENMRIYTNANNDVMFSYDYLAVTVKSLKLATATDPYAVTALYDIILKRLFQPTAHKIIHLVAAAPTKIALIPASTVRNLLEQYGITLHLLLPCTFTAGFNEILGIDRSSVYKVADADAFPVVGDREMRRNTLDCHDPLVDLAQWNFHGSIFNDRFVRASAIIQKNAALIIQSRLISQTAKLTALRCQCAMNANNLARMVCFANQENHQTNEDYRQGQNSYQSRNRDQNQFNQNLRNLNLQQQLQQNS